jgi:tRNA pseudouridine-54 N-methylase
MMANMIHIEENTTNARCKAKAFFMGYIRYLDLICSCMTGALNTTHHIYSKNIALHFVCV